jgi:1,2-diacylglycerol 3-alpha-glucosyltransferase
VKILNVSDVYFPRVNGVSTSIQTFSRELAKLGHECHLIAPDYGQKEATGPHEPRLIRVPSWKVPFDPEDRFMTPAKLRAMGPWLREQGYDILHIQTPFLAHKVGVELGRKLGVPVVETYHTFFEEYLHHYLPLLPRAVARRIARHFSRRQCNEVDAVVVPSRAMEEALRGYGVTTFLEKLPTGLRLEDLRGGNGQAFRDKFRIPAERPTITHIGRVAFEKNIGFLLEVLAKVAQRVPEVLMVIAGEGPALPALRRQVVDLGLQDHVLFVGYLDRATELLDCYRAADAFVFASRTETQGLVLLEAMALAVPVVSTAVMGTKDILEPGLGALVAEEDTEDFAGKVVEVLQNAELRCRLRREARDYVARSWEAGAMARRLEELYQRLLAGRQELRQAA